LNPLRSALEQLALDFARSLLRAVAGASASEAAAVVGVPGVQAVASPEAPPLSPGAKLVAKLTDRERMIFEGAVHGASNVTLSRDLKISVKTVQTHRAKINLKLGVHSPGELIRFAVMHGMLTPDHAAASAPGTGFAPTFNLAEVERQTIEAALRATSQDRARAASLLGIAPSVLAWKLDSSGGGDGPRSTTRRARAGTTSTRRRGRSSARAIDAKPAEDDPAGAITDPWTILGALGRKEKESDTPPPTRRSAPTPVAATATRSERRPAVRPGEDLLVASGGGVVLRRRRSGAAAT
jgi:DNA-binding CsgD family transcriptional regulator